MTVDAGTFDVQMMAIALRLAERALGSTAPNPAVGAVIADAGTGELIARAATARGGRPHAETQAIVMAGGRARGATMYVTLEPCSHHGHTGPCADAIITSGVARVVVAIEDPDPRVGGRGLDRLRAAGIAVERGLGAGAARWLTRGHIVRITERRPFVTLKLAVDFEGQIAPGDGTRPRWVTGAQARAHGHILRARHDAILVGSGTIVADDPELTCRLPGLADRSPVRVILAREFDVSRERKIVQWAREVPTWIIGSRGAGAGRRQRLAESGATFIEVATVNDTLWLPAVMEELVARGITRLLVEGGPSMWRAFADASLVDEVVLYMAEAADGVAAGEDAARGALQRWLGRDFAANFEMAERRRIDADVMWRFRRVMLTEGL